jgi:hypothetical protein
VAAVIYGSEEQAFRRVEGLKQRGVWPGVRRVFGGWELTYDPADLGEPPPDLPSAPNSELGWERRRTQREPGPSTTARHRPDGNTWAAAPPVGVDRRLP